MAIPIIDKTISILAWTQGGERAFQPVATGTPTSWAATGLPAGVDISATTGLIQGAPEVSGVYNVKLTATNGDGVSAPVHVAIGVEPSALETGDSIAIAQDLATGYVSGPIDPTTGVCMYAKAGDVIPVTVAFSRGGIPQPLTLAQLRIGLKEFESEALVPLNDGSEFELLGSYETTRFRLMLDFSGQAVRSLLANYEGASGKDDGAFFDALFEIEAVILTAPIGGGDPIECPRTSQTARIRIERDLIRA